MAHRRRNDDLAGLPRPRRCKAPAGMLGEVEQLEEPVDDVDFLRIALDIEEQGAAERENLLGPEAIHPPALLTCSTPASQRISGR
jgi:hypothetical protein